MMKAIHRNHSRAFKAKMSPAALNGEKCWPIRPSRSMSISTRSRSTERPETFACKGRRANAIERFFVRSARQGRHADRKAVITPRHDLQLTRQARVLSISRSAAYEKACPVPPRDLMIMRRMDE